MLKDIFKRENTKNNKEKIPLSIIDGYVDVKAYKHNEKGEKKLVYHNAGDNTVTNWMRQVIMLLLSGYSLSLKGSQYVSSNGDSLSNTINSNQQFSKPNTDVHNLANGTNLDGYCLNGSQYISDFKSDTSISNDDASHNFYPVLNNGDLWGEDEELYALFPTKILLGTGCEYTDWDTLKEFNETDNATWYSDIVQQYGNGSEDTAKNNFNKLVAADGADNSNFKCNTYSGTIGSQGTYTGNGAMVPTVTVNDPDTTSNVTSTADMSKRYGVVGAIKTLYLPASSGDTMISSVPILEATVSDSGRLETGQFRGAGRPCFIYFRRSKLDDNIPDWGKQVSDVYVSKDTNSTFLNRITFRIVIPAQSSGNAAVGEYNPFNGYTFKQVGLFNDAIFSTEPGTDDTDTAIASKMPCGTLLAIKNIQSFTKTADESIEFTWTLTI